MKSVHDPSRDLGSTFDRCGRDPNQIIGSGESPHRTFVMLVMEDYFRSLSNALVGDKRLNASSYDTCARELFQRSIYYGDSYLRSFSDLNRHVVQVVPDCRPLQAKWAAQRKLHLPPKWVSRFPFSWLWRKVFSCSPEQWSRERIFADQVRYYRPRFLWFFSGAPITAGLLQRCRSFVDHIVLWWSCPISPEIPYSDFDLVLSGIPDLVEYFQVLGINAAHLPHAFDETILHRVGPARGRESKIAFVGANSPQHVERLLVLDLLARHVGIEIYGSGWENLPLESALRRCYRGPAWGDRIYEIYSTYTVAFHHNIAIAGSSLSAKRLFEAAGMGACVLCQDPKNPSALLMRPEHEIITYKTREECLQKARFLLDNPEKAEQIGQSAQQRILKEHLYSHRTVNLVKLFEQLDVPERKKRPR